MVQEWWPRRCDGCGEMYDARDRRVRGPFHFRVMSADAESDATHRLVGHWRAGLWLDGESLELRCKDGHTVRLLEATMDEPVSVKAGQRGQAVLHVRAEKADDVQAGGCIWMVR
jgi:hypothetical protein